MAHVPVDPSLETTTKLELLESSGGEATDSCELITPSNEGWQRNVDIYQTLGSSEANSRGDGRIIIRPRTATVLVQPISTESIYRRLYLFEQNVADATHLRYGSVELELVGKASLTNPTFIGEKAVQVTLRYLPKTAQAKVSSDPVLGPI